MTARRLDPNGDVGHSSGVTRDWKRLGQMVVRGRLELGFKKADDFAQEIEISRRTLSNLENGKSVSAATLAGVERGLGWAPGSTDAVLDHGGKPTLLSKAAGGVGAEQRPPSHAIFQQLSLQLVQLESGIEADVEPSSDFLEVLEDIHVLLHVLRRLGVASCRKAVIDLAKSYKAEL